MQVDSRQGDQGVLDIRHYFQVLWKRKWLILAVLALIISAIVWALGANSSNPHLAGRGKFGVLVGLGAAIVTGASVALVNFFWNVGQSV